VELSGIEAAAAVAYEVYKALDYGVSNYTDSNGDEWAVTSSGATVTLTQVVAKDFAAANLPALAPVKDPDDALVSFTDEVSANGKTEIADNGIEVAITTDQEGHPEQGELQYTQAYEILEGSGDYLDFSDYGVAAVYVDGKNITGNISGTNHKYVSLSQITTEDAGVYNIRVLDAGTDGVGTNDSVVTVIGIADFGEAPDFIADNFII
jgi:hypothetical protein